MTPAARLQAAIEILDWLGKTDQPLDRFLRDWFRARRYAGSKDRREIGERVFRVQRQRASLAWRMGSETARSLVVASLLNENENPEPHFTGDGYGPSALTDAERARIAAIPGPLPVWARGEFPAFLESELARAFGDALEDEMQAFQARAPVDLRVNTLKTTRNSVLAALVDESFAAAPTRWSPFGIRIPAGEGAGLAKSALFEAGAFEFQDESAQIATLLCGVEPGLRILDLAAGAGGKTLGLAAVMENRGEIVACDVRGPALEQLKLRAARAGITIVRTRLSGEGPPPGLFDHVFVDAPCTGSGTWRRQPELKWRLTPERLAELDRLQDRLLDEGAALLAPEGHLVYATCSILPNENEDRVAAFLARTPGFAVREAAGLWAAATKGATGPSLRGPSSQGLSLRNMGEFFRATPFSTGTDGFFCAVLGRT